MRTTPARITMLLLCSSLPPLVSACSTMSGGPATQPSNLSATMPADKTEGSLSWWQAQTVDLPGKGTLANDVYTITIPRSDVWVQSADLGTVPAEAGLESRFHLFRCTCGKTKVAGDMCVTDYESNDVLDALRGGHFLIASMSPILMDEKPKMMSIRFQGEAPLGEVVETLRSALRWTGPERAQ